MLIDTSNGVWPLILAIAFAFAIVGCEKDEPWKKPGPKGTFDAFLMHWLRGEAELAFDYILPEDREALVAPLKKLEDVPEERRPKPHEMLVVAGVVNLYDIQKMEVKEPLESKPAEGETVVVTVHRQDGTKSNAELVWSEGRWYVDLPLETSESEG